MQIEIDIGNDIHRKNIIAFVSIALCMLAQPKFKYKLVQMYKLLLILFSFIFVYFFPKIQEKKACSNFQMLAND